MASVMGCRKADAAAYKILPGCRRPRGRILVSSFLEQFGQARLRGCSRRGAQFRGPGGKGREFRKSSPFDTNFGPTFIMPHQWSCRA